jgi:competence protein ComEA
MNKKKVIGMCIISVLAIVFLVIGYNIQKSNKSTENSDLSIVDANKYNKDDIDNSSDYKDNESNSEDKKEINAQIYGEVKKPGVYSLDNGERIKDLIDKAGGFTANADCFSINGAKKLNDGDDIQVKAKNQENTKVNDNNSEGNISSADSENDKIDINSATEDDIVNKKIPGIGKGLADKIIKFRESNGGKINSEEDMEKAIGPTRGKKIMDYIEIN